MNSFNPYQHWLGIPDAHGTPNHYRLLGLRLFEDLPATISAAVAEAGNVLCRHLSGPDASDAQRLLQEIESARLCLLNPAAKAQYDAALRQQLTAVPPNPVSTYAAAEAIDPLLPPTARSYSPVAPAALPTPPSGAATWPAANGLPSLPAGALPMPGAGQSPSTSTTPAAGGYPAVPVPATPPLGNYYPPGNYPSAAAAPTPPLAYAPMAPLAQTPLAMPVAAPVAYSPAAIPVAAPAPQAAMGVPIAAAAAPMAMPVYSPSTSVPQAAIAVAQPALPQAAMAPYHAADSATAFVTPRTRVHWRPQKAPTQGVLLATATAVLVVVAAIVVALNQPDNGPSNGPGQPVASAPQLSPEALATKQARAARHDSIPAPPGPAKTSARTDSPASSLDSGVAMNNVAPPAPAMPVPTPAAPVPVPTPPPTPTPKPTSTPTPTPPPAKPDARKNDVVTTSLNLARVALSKGDVRGARAQVDVARKADVPSRTDEIDRVEALAKYTEDFDNAVRGGIKNLQIGGQFAVKESFVGVVEVQPDTIVLRIEGQNKTFPIAGLPAAVAYALADSWLRKEDAASKIILGVYQAMHPRGDRMKARDLWQAAALGGAKIAAEQLLPELDVPLPTDAGMQVADAKPGEDGRFTMPGASDQTKARAEVRQMFEADYAEAKDAAMKMSLAAKLLKRAQEPSETSAIRYVLLQEAAKLAAEGGDFESMIAAADRLGEQYKLDAIVLKADALFDASRSVEGKDANQALAAAGLTLCDEAVLLDKVDVALKIARTASTAAKKSGDADLIKQCSAREKEVRDLKK